MQMRSGPLSSGVTIEPTHPLPPGHQLQGSREEARPGEGQQVRVQEGLAKGNRPRPAPEMKWGPEGVCGKSQAERMGWTVKGRPRTPAEAPGRRPPGRTPWEDRKACAECPARARSHTVSLPARSTLGEVTLRPGRVTGARGSHGLQMARPCPSDSTVAAAQTAPVRGPGVGGCA